MRPSFLPVLPLVGLMLIVPSCTPLAESAPSAPATVPQTPASPSPATTTSVAPASTAAPDAPTPPADTPTTGEATPSSTAVQRDMLRHDELAEKSRAAIVAGDLDAFRLGMEIAAVQPLPGKLADQASTFVARARVGANVNDVVEASRALGQVGAACAECHKAVPRDRYPATGFEEGDNNVIDRMQRHWWATDALWQGLVQPDDGAWQVGAQTLADQSLTRVPGFPETAEAKARAAGLQAAARAALLAKGAEGRGKAFGELIAQCAGCHQALGRGPVMSSE